MTGRDNSQWSRPGPSRQRPGTGASDDVVEQGDGEPPGRLPRIAIALGVAGLIVGLVVGYTAGHQGNHPAVAAPASTPSASASPSRTFAATSPEDGPPLGGPDSLVQTSSQCATQTGRHLLQLGVQMLNQSASLLTLDYVQAEEPLHGLKVVSLNWGTCGELHSTNAVPGRFVAPEGTTWLTATFRVLVKCPGALPVNFTVHFFQEGRHFAAQLPGFVDLGHVPYQGCPVSG